MKMDRSEVHYANKKAKGLTHVGETLLHVAVVVQKTIFKELGNNKIYIHMHVFFLFFPYNF